MATTEQRVRTVSKNPSMSIRQTKPSLLNQRFFTFLLYLITIITALAFSVPFLWTIASSLKSASELHVFPPTFFPETIRWKNYSDVFTLVPFARFIWNTVIITALAMIG